MKTKVIRLNELQIRVLKQFLTDASYYISADHYAFIQGDRKTFNEVVLSILNDIMKKLKE